MRQSQLFSRTTKDIPSDEVSKNAQLLIRAGFVHKTMAGVYSYLPLGLRVLNKIEDLVREGMNSIGGQEILMNSLQPKDVWVQTDRWNSVDVLFKIESQTKNQYALAPTHEEQITTILKSFVSSHKDLPSYNPNSNQFPIAVYQIQTKFRDELRSKSGLMRGREFRMKDMYDLHQNKISQSSYFELVTQTYHRIYSKMGLQSYAVDASGGGFSEKFSREFQVICSAGEDVTVYCPDNGFAANIEVLDQAKAKWIESGKVWNDNLREEKSAEVGNIFDLGQKWIKAFDLSYNDSNNQKQYPYMGCHGIGTSRCMGVIAEIYSDDKGLKWPESVAPFKIHIITHLDKDEAENAQILKLANQIYNGDLVLENGILIPNQGSVSPGENILWDDRSGISIGEKLKDADLIGCPWQIIISKRSLAAGAAEIRKR